MNLYTILDRLAEEFGPVFEAKNDRVALRMFQDMIQSKKLPDEEFELHHLAKLERNNMNFEIKSNSPRRIISGLGSAEENDV